MFKVGDEIICIDNIYRDDIFIGRTYIVQEVNEFGLVKIFDSVIFFAYERFELAVKPILYPTLRSDYV